MSFSKKDPLKTLLIGRDFRKQQLRAVAFRNSDSEVHTAANIDGCLLWTAHSYDLVLLSAGSIHRSSRTKFLPSTS
jgi:hypothetical protein